MGFGETPPCFRRLSAMPPMSRRSAIYDGAFTRLSRDIALSLSPSLPLAIISFIRISIAAVADDADDARRIFARDRRRRRHGHATT